jgi:hypothetical protein
MTRTEGDLLHKAPIVIVQSVYTQSHKLRPRPRLPQEAKFSTLSIFNVSTLWPGVLLRPAHSRIPRLFALPVAYSESFQEVGFWGNKVPGGVRSHTFCSRGGVKGVGARRGGPRARDRSTPWRAEGVCVRNMGPGNDPGKNQGERNHLWHTRSINFVWTPALIARRSTNTARASVWGSRRSR